MNASEIQRPPLQRRAGYPPARSRQAFYVPVAAACLWAGLFTDWTFGRGR